MPNSEAKPSSKTKTRIKAVANKWMSDNLNGESKYLHSGNPEFDKSKNLWAVQMYVKNFTYTVGEIRIDHTLKVVRPFPRLSVVTRRLKKLFGGGGSSLYAALPPLPMIMSDRVRSSTLYITKILV